MAFRLKAEKDWPQKLCVDHGAILLRWMLAGERSAQQEADAIAGLLLEAGVGPGERVLDFCCGYGRHSLRLAERGYKVTGVDISEASIRHARELALERNVSEAVRFLVGDVRRLGDLLSPTAGFGAAIGILPAIGYYDKKTDESVFRQIHQLTRPGGVLILSVGNGEHHILEPSKVLRERVGGTPAYEIHHALSFNRATSRLQDIWKIHEASGQGLVHVSTVKTTRRLYSLQELVGLYAKTGWRYLKAFGNYQLEPVEPTRPVMTVVGAR